MGNFLPYFKSKNIQLTSGLQDGYTREELYRETKRLSQLAKRRERRLEKSGYASQDLDILKSRNDAVMIRHYKRKGYDENLGSWASVKKDLTEREYRELIGNYQIFLSGRGNTPELLDDEFADLANDYSKKYGKEISSRDLSNVFAWLKNNDVGHMLSEALGSDEVVDDIFNGDIDTDTALSKAENYINEHPMDWDVQGFRDLFKE